MMIKMNDFKTLLTMAIIACFMLACLNNDEESSITEVKTADQLDALHLELADLLCNHCANNLSYSTCSALTKFKFRSDRSETISSLQNGRIVFNPNVYQCTQTQIRQRNCKNIEIACPGKIFEPTVSIGGACNFPFECQVTPYQNVDCVKQNNQVCQMGVCQLDSSFNNPVNLGQSCQDQENVYSYCLGDTVCNNDPNDPRCVAVQYAQPGQVCDQENNTIECVNSYCAYVDESYQTSVCKVLKQLYEPCNDLNFCDWSLYCSPQGTCLPRIQDQALCTDSLDFDLDDTSCQIGSACINEICKPGRFLGEACEVNEQCLSSGSRCIGNVCTQVCL